MSPCGCHYRMLNEKVAFSNWYDQWVENSSIMVHRHVGGYGAAPCRCHPLFIATMITLEMPLALNN